MGGPYLLGEGSVGIPARFCHKTQMLNDYRDMTRMICLEYKVNFMDMRKLALAAIPFYWVYYKGYLTVDGEHENDRGTALVAKEFSRVIKMWFSHSEKIANDNSPIKSTTNSI